MQSRLVIFGDCSIARALERTVSGALQDFAAERCADIRELRNSITQVAMSSEFRSTTHVLCVARLSRRLTSEDAFSIHCHLRQPFRIGRREFAWEGGIVFLGGDKKDCQALAGVAPFNAIPGHAVVPLPHRLIDIFVALNDLEPLRQHAWSEVLDILGLSDFWAMFDAAERALKRGSVPEAVANLTAILTSVLESGILEKLLAHIEVRRELIRVVSTAEGAANDTDTAAQMFDTVRLAMARYRLA